MPLNKWGIFIIQLRDVQIEFESFKVIQLAQAMLESGFGASGLFHLGNNPYGLKYRKEMASVATKIRYKNEDYCQFESTLVAITAYWQFLDRPVYNGYKQQTDYFKFLEHIVKCGYFAGTQEQKFEYMYKVARLVPQSLSLLREPQS